jgi:hypothetical protein
MLTLLAFASGLSVGFAIGWLAGLCRGAALGEDAHIDEDRE